MLISAGEAAARLGVQRKTLYTYVSRGWLTSLRGPDGRCRCYSAEEVERLRRSAEAGRGHRAVATAALAHGPPVVDTAICQLTSQGPRYRGVQLSQLVDLGFEHTCALLWERPVEAHALVAPTVDMLRPHGTWLALLGTHAEAGPSEALHALVATVGPLQGTVARTLATAWGRPAAESAIDRALVVCAEHELNASTFAVRVASSTGSPLAFALAAGVATHAGARHGGLGHRLEDLLDDMGAVPSHRRRAWVVDRAHKDTLPGFGHPLYASGDPRVPWLLQGLPPCPLTEELLHLVDTEDLVAPNLDGGLVALRRAWGLPRGAATVLFGIGRIAGWVAHAIEASDGPLIRPRARYRVV